MCDTDQGLELTRMTIVDENCTVILDMLVRPSLPITDYRTQWSGITKELLECVTVTFPQAQLAFMRLIGAETFLIGDI